MLSCGLKIHEHIGIYIRSIVLHHVNMSKDICILKH